jgi:bifunctional UDP-N-acetylglucosamine pyrophosphorylase / glucosamine-1-phosphate N-acetyltransferase
MPLFPSLSILVLAAGKGTRMHSDKPKVLHTLLGEPMLWHVLNALRPLRAGNLHTIIGHRADMVRHFFPEESCILQESQNGTGHAVLCAWPRILEDKTQWCLVVNGDAPLMDTTALQHFCEAMIQKDVDLGFISLHMADPQSYGRVVRNSQGTVQGIIEAKDFDPAVHAAPSGEVNAGIYLLRCSTVGPLLSGISNQNQQQEYYLTDLVDLAVRQGLKVDAMPVGDSPDFMGVNSPVELAASEDALRERIVNQLLRSGVTIHAASSVRIGPRAEIQPGCEIFGPCEVYGQCQIAAGTVLESHTWIQDSHIGANSRIRSFSHLEGARVHSGCVVGPFARLRPGSVLEDEARLGNFVEIKKATLGKGAKASHLSYLGDAHIGAGANIGAGTITCNYDGKRKHHTEVGPQAFIGSNTALVAPVRVGANALVGAGSVITKDVPDNTLAVARGRQQNFPRKVED